jgi:ABC-type multidrug transport system fused ATPase/permease subunit
VEHIFLLSQTSSGGEAAGAAAAGSVLVILIISLVFWLLLGIFSILALVMWIIALMHVVQHEDVKDRIVWLIIILTIGGIGAFVYYFVVMRPYARGGMRATADSHELNI